MSTKISQQLGDVSVPQASLASESSFRIALVACLLTCVDVAAVYLTQPIFADLAGSYGVPLATARFSFVLVSITYAVAFFFIGPLSDVIAAKRLACGGLVIAALALLGAVASQTFTIFLIALAFLGASAACVPSAMFALMPRIAPPKRVGTYFGLVIAASVVGITLGRSGMGIFAAAVGWRTAFVWMAVLLLVMSGVSLSLPSQRKEAKSAFERLLTGYSRAVRMLKDIRLIAPLLAGFFLYVGYLGAVTFLTLHLHSAPFFYDSATIGRISLVGIGAVVRGGPVRSDSFLDF